MANVGVLPNSSPQTGEGTFLTFIVPARAGCDLKCPFCIIKQRNEVAESQLRPADLMRFIRQARDRGNIFAVAVQGYEPLLPESIPFTQAVLSTGRLLGLPTGLITNGTRLTHAAQLLRALQPTQLTISLDSSVASLHDKLRGQVGAWEATIGGIEHVVPRLASDTSVAIASVLLPGNKGQLQKMPALLSDLGIDHWVLNPLLKITASRESPIVRINNLVNTLRDICGAAKSRGIRIIIDDELDVLKNDPLWSQVMRDMTLTIRRIPENVRIVRLLPSGKCSVGTDILKTFDPQTPRWEPMVEHAGEYLDRIIRQAEHA